MTKIESEGEQVVAAFVEESENPEKVVLPKVEKGGGEAPTERGRKVFYRFDVVS